MDTPGSEKKWMIYGVTGYTGKHCAEEAVRRGLQPVVAGRNRKLVEAAAAKLNLPCAVFSLDQPDKAAAALQDMDLVLNCAGPFSATIQPFLEACVRSRCHYLDVTGEIPVFEYVHPNTERWKEAGIAVVPGVGFDVVPTDCIAALLKEALPDAVQLRMAFKSKTGKVSPGTAKTILEGFSKGGMIRHEGRLVSIPSGSLVRKIPYADGEYLSVSIPWGDVSTAYYSTGIPNIELYTAMPEDRLQLVRLMRYLAPLVRLRPVQRLIKNQIAQTVKGPTEAERLADTSELYGVATNGAGERKEIWMSAPNGYTLTFDAAVSAAERVLEEEGFAGAYTPSQAFGADFAGTLEGVSLRFSEES